MPDYLVFWGGSVPPSKKIIETCLVSSLNSWWNNKALMARLNLTDDQKSRIEAAYENPPSPCGG